MGSAKAVGEKALGGGVLGKEASYHLALSQRYPSIRARAAREVRSGLQRLKTAGDNVPRLCTGCQPGPPSVSPISFGFLATCGLASSLAPPAEHIREHVKYMVSSYVPHF